MCPSNNIRCRQEPTLGVYYDSRCALCPLHPLYPRSFHTLDPHTLTLLPRHLHHSPFLLQAPSSPPVSAPPLPPFLQQHLLLHRLQLLQHLSPAVWYSPPLL